MNVKVIFAVLVVAPVPFVTTIVEDVPATFVTLSIVKAAPVVAPTMLYIITVPIAAIDVLLITNDCVAPAAMLTPLKVTWPDLPLAVCGDAPAATTTGAVFIPPVSVDNPDTASVVNAPAAGVVVPIAGGDANKAATEAEVVI